MAVYHWSQTAASNASADPSINWTEGQLAPTNNDSFRAVMAAIKSWLVDISGNLQTTGGPAAFNVTTNQGFTNLSQLKGQMLVVKFNQTNTGAFTLNVDGLGAISVQAKGIASFPPFTLQVSSAYALTYDDSIGIFNATVSA